MKNNLKKIDFLFYQGLGFFSGFIRWRTRSKYSHVAIRMGKDVYEAREKKGCVKHDDPFKHCSKKTIIEPIAIHVDQKTYEQIIENLEFDVAANKNKKKLWGIFKISNYDYEAIFSFLGTWNRQNPNKWFCSEWGYRRVLVEYLKTFPRFKEKDKLVSPGILKEMVYSINTTNF